MVSYFNPTAMFRHQQALAAQNAQFHHGSSPMPTWYAGGYHHQGGPPQHPGGAPTPSYCMQDEQQMWHHPTPHHSIFQQEYSEVIHSGMPSLHHQQVLDPESQLPSPPITVSGSDMSSPGAGNGNGNVSPPSSRPPPARSPYEWIKKPSYQSQPNPGKTRTRDKYRIVYTDHQRIELEKEFYYSRYITIRQKAEIASNLGLTERQVKIWFQNRRAKERKQVKKKIETSSQNPDLNGPEDSSYCLTSKMNENWRLEKDKFLT
ncbi:homeotic protein caudal-like isoform X2 [Agrilus planipennis]|uniref:Homeotic protein caudal-like isoform X2 n=1 Tax=Agrilus planipennis TaxID=224129 RepID=A0A1W4X9G9_AGRPL|nr:homeotic protein caudal-like isoform X2 [Agrilus planipennis]